MWQVAFVPRPSHAHVDQGPMFTNKSTRWKNRWVVFAGAAATASGLAAVRAADLTWTGAGADNNWTTAANWLGGVAPAPGDRLVFDGTTRLTATNNFPVDTSFGGIIFAP